MCLWGIKCVFMGKNQIKMCVYGEKCDSPMLHLRSQTLKCVFMGNEMCVYGE